MTESYQLAHHSVPKNPDRKCGDHIAVLELPEEGLVVLAVSDGVSTLAQDWKSSETACTAFSDAIHATVGLSSEDRLRGAALAAHEAVQGLEGAFAGGMATLVALIWKVGADEAHIVGVGDSRIHRCSPQGICQLTEDDKTSVRVEDGGRPVLSAGSVASTPGITKALGQDGGLDLQVQNVPFEEGDTLALISDGCHEVGEFKITLNALETWGDLATPVARYLFGTSGGRFNDDASAIFLRRTEIADSRRAAHLEAVRTGKAPKTAGLHGHMILTAILDDIREAADSDELEPRSPLVDYLAQQNIVMTRERLSETLNALSASEDDLAIALRKKLLKQVR